MAFNPKSSERVTFMSLESETLDITTIPIIHQIQVVPFWNLNDCYIGFQMYRVHVSEGHLLHRRALHSTNGLMAKPQEAMQLDPTASTVLGSWNRRAPSFIYTIHFHWSYK